jgi:hypothetical protein
VCIRRSSGRSAARCCTPDTRCYNRLLTTLRAPTERAHALLGYWRALHRITVCPWRIGAITAAALVLLHHQHGRTT